ncbi:MAG: helix-turn-helix transcriptional regulator [Clostridia bacterium]|nr:helix-turn-helix transcriptional regulator [Clostridia bacterium]
MIHAYQEIYVSNAQSTLGDTFDYAINICKIPGEDFIKLFMTSSLAKRIEKGEPAVIVGKSGIEIAMDVLLETTGKQYEIIQEDRMDRSIEYWIGWAIAYYQWYSARSYADMFKVLTFENLKKMYYTLHEADITKFVEIVDEKIKEYFKDTNLKRIRVLYGCSQAELSRQSGVGLRSIQMYEQRNKDINKASVETIYNLAKTLGCTIEDLIEK